MKILDCCSRPAQANLYEVKYEIVDGRYAGIPCWNRICTNCYAHWYGHPDRLTKFTKQEWDLLINSTFDEEPAKLDG